MFNFLAFPTLCSVMFTSTARTDWKEEDTTCHICMKFSIFYHLIIQYDWNVLYLVCLHLFQNWTAIDSFELKHILAIHVRIHSNDNWYGTQREKWTPCNIKMFHTHLEVYTFFNFFFNMDIFCLLLVLFGRQCEDQSNGSKCPTAAPFWFCWSCICSTGNIQTLKEKQ